MQRFEYKVVEFGKATSIPWTDLEHHAKFSAAMEAQLNELGADGWELVQINAVFLYFKRVFTS